MVIIHKRFVTKTIERPVLQSLPIELGKITGLSPAGIPQKNVATINSSLLKLKSFKTSITTRGITKSLITEAIYTFAFLSKGRISYSARTIPVIIIAIGAIQLEALFKIPLIQEGSFIPHKPIIRPRAIEIKNGFERTLFTVGF